MRLLIATQAVDKRDPVLGFFHGWIEEFSKHCEKISVICLKEGSHHLPKNVVVHSLGKSSFQGLPSDSEGSPWATWILYIWRFYKYIWILRKEHDAVFVHMNQEYVLLGGPFWILLGKRIILWRNHKIGSPWTNIASFFAHKVCYTSSSAYVASFRNAVQMPIGVDTDFFKPMEGAEPNSILFLGRLDAVKKPDVFLRAMEVLRRDGNGAHADVYGDPTPGREDFARKLKTDFASLKRVSFHPAVRNDETPAIYNAHAIYVNLTPSGSFDKTIGEAMACGSVVIVANDAVRSVVPPAHAVDSQSAESVAAGLRAALALSTEKRKELANKMRRYVAGNHSLALLASRLFALYKPVAHTPIMIKPLKQGVLLILSLFPARLTALSIIMYHSVSDSGAFFAVSTERFKQQRQYVRDSGFDSVFASEIPERLQAGKLARTVCVTFDDGYEDVYTNAFPILKTFGIKATVFLITGQIGGSYTNSERRAFPLLRREQIEEMRASGLVEFMPHGHTHRKLHQLTETEQEKEITVSRDIVKSLTGSSPKVFAYPRGRTNPEIAKLLENSGYKLALGVLSGLVHPDSDRYNLPRNAVGHNVGFREFKLKLSDTIAWYVAMSRFFR